MKIKQIEMYGFKSFSDKTLLSFHDGITCIVGPNGCGKSNVVDAFRWVLGEQSAKSLRGEKMEEVIFQGSSAKKPKGMAEVMLTATHTRNPGNGDGETRDEFVVARRLYRSGESEYLMNKKQCRLRDIKDVFLDTGLDVKSYSILDQGKIGEIINAKPLDRRFLIEEVAGVMKYKVRRAEALSKLESSKQNLQRISDIVYEVKRQINSLDRQVKKAERYKRLMAELREVELRSFKREFSRLSAILMALNSDVQRLGEADAARRGELSHLENLTETGRIELVEKEKTLGELENNLHEKEREIAGTETRTAVLKTGTEGHRADIERFLRQQEEADTKKAELLDKIAGLKESEASLITDIEKVSLALEQQKSSVAGIEATIKEKELKSEYDRAEILRLSGILGNENNDRHKLQSSIENLDYRENTARNDMDSIKAELQKLINSINEEGSFILSKTSECSGLRNERDGLIREIDLVLEDIEKRKGLLAGEREDLASDTSRLNSLVELTFDKTLAEFLTESPGHLRMTKGVLSDIISAAKDFEKAVEAVLTYKVNSLVVDNQEDLRTAISIIREKHLGRTSLLYTGYGEWDRKIEPMDISHASLVGRASDYISFDNPDNRTMIGDLLENTYIVKDLEAAIGLRRNCALRDCILVTLDGEVIDADGVIFAGRDREILRMKREIKELRSMITKRQTLIGEMESGLNALTSGLNARRERVKAVENAVVEMERDLSLAEHSLKGKKEEQERKTRRISFLETEITSISIDKTSMKALLDTKSSEISRLEQELTVMNEGLTAAQQLLADIRRQYDEARSQLHELKVAHATGSERIDSLGKEIAGLQNTILDLEQRKETAIQEIGNAEEKIRAAGEEMGLLEDALKTFVEDAAALGKERTELKDTIEAKNLALTEEALVLKKVRSEIDATSQELGIVKTSAAETRLKIEHIESAVSQKYGLVIAGETIETEGFEPAADEEAIAQLNQKVRDLGMVNLGTIEEYEELKTRYDFLTKQQDDLNLSIAELEEAISRINITTRKKLREAYEALRTKFGEVFVTLFGGGKADLILTDEENILESGLDVIAQPPGKKLQNLNLLSGGEKALTSLALLFAGFLIKPSPLCVLDEADAPLDESNTVRFAQMIKSLSQETQFIIITHNRTTMEVADYIYGITMEEPGSSKAISLQFSDVEGVAPA
jgi:chromosome segregation protein